MWRGGEVQGVDAPPLTSVMDVRLRVVIILRQWLLVDVALNEESSVVRSPVAASPSQTLSQEF